VAESPTDDQQHRRRRAVVDLMPSTPYMSWLGIVFDRYEPDDVTIRLPFREDLKNTDGNVVAHAVPIVSMIPTVSWPGTNANPPASSPGVLLVVGAAQPAGLHADKRVVIADGG
jgi:hypothetical protein